MTGSARVVVLWVGAIIVGLVALVSIAYVAEAPPSRKPLVDYVAKVKAAGQPVTVEEVLGPPPPPETNGAVDFESACKWLDEQAGPRDKWTYAGPWGHPVNPKWFDEEPPERLAALDRFLTSLQPFFDGVAAALAKPRLTPTTTRSPEGYVVQSGVPRLLDSIPVIRARALAASRAQDRLDAVALLLALSTRIGGDGAMSQIAAGAASLAGVFALRRDMERGAVDVVAARARLDAFLAEPLLPRVPAMVAFQRVQMLDDAAHADFSGRGRRGTFSSLVAEVGDQIEHAIRGTPAPRLPVYRGSPTEFAEAHAAFAPLESLPTDSYPRMIREIRAFVASTPDTPFVQAWMPADPRFVEHFARADASRHLARIALAASEHRAKHGDFPASLDELKPMFPDGVPLDPYTDAPFVYERTATGARIASLGRLREDEPLDDATLRERCLVWELKR